MKPKKINNSRKGGNSLDMNQTSQLFFLGGGMHYTTIVSITYNMLNLLISL